MPRSARLPSPAKAAAVAAALLLAACAAPPPPGVNRCAAGSDCAAPRLATRSVPPVEPVTPAPQAYRPAKPRSATPDVGGLAIGAALAFF